MLSWAGASSGAVPEAGRRRAIAAIWAGALLGAALLLPGEASPQAIKLSDAEFWRLVSELSEPGGYFRSDNFVSNETSYQHPMAELVRERAGSGVYLGVGPEQNFSYIVALRPRLAFILDVRRQAVVQHLMYKALIEMARDRAEFLALLFSRPQTSNPSQGALPEQLVQWLYAVPPDSAMYWRTLHAVRERLTRVHGFALEPEDLTQLEYVFTSFYLAGPDITYNYPGGRSGFSGRGMPTFAQLVLESDGQGNNWSFLATEENFRSLREMQASNSIIPVVGDFGGPKALRAIGSYLKEHGLTVKAIYTSNVEQYLFQSTDAWRRYYESVATLPLDSSSVFVRAVFNFGGYRPPSPSGPRSVTVLSPVLEFLKAYAEGRINSYSDVVMFSR
jgi:hypothetical protein